MAKVIERLQAHYEVHDVEMGKVYRWHPESTGVLGGREGGLVDTIALEHDGECCADHRPLVEEVLEVGPKELVYHPWRSPSPYYAPTRGA